LRRVYFFLERVNESSKGITVPSANIIINRQLVKI